MSQKGFSAIILLLPLVAAVVLIVFFAYSNAGKSKNTIPVKQTTSGAVDASPKPSVEESSIQIPFTAKAMDDVSSIYTNNSLGFKFTYAKGFLIKEDTEEEFNKRGLTDFRKNFTGYIQYSPAIFAGAVVVLDTSNLYAKNPFTVWIFENPDNTDIDSWYKKYWYYPFVWGDFSYEEKSKLSPQKESTISGSPVKSGMVDYQEGKPKFTYLSKDGKMYLFRTIGSNGEAILNTFQFLK